MLSIFSTSHFLHSHYLLLLLTFISASSSLSFSPLSLASKLLFSSILTFTLTLRKQRQSFSFYLFRTCLPTVFSFLSCPNRKVSFYCFSLSFLFTFRHWHWPAFSLLISDSSSRCGQLIACSRPLRNGHRMIAPASYFYFLISSCCRWCWCLFCLHKSTITTFFSICQKPSSLGDVNGGQKIRKSDNCTEKADFLLILSAAKAVAF